MSKTTRIFVAASIAVSLVATAPLLAEGRIAGKIVAVSDGDTLVLHKGRKNYALQIAGIDAPELGQDHGTEAREFLESQVRGQRVEVEIVEESDRSIVGRVSVDGRDLALTMVEAGLAWPTEGAPAALEEAASSARRSGEGLWSSDEPTPPWSFRAESASG